MRRALLPGALYGGDRVVLYQRAGVGQVLHTLLKAARHGTTPWDWSGFARDHDQLNVVLLRQPRPDEILATSAMLADLRHSALVVALDVDTAMARRYALAALDVSDRQALVVQVRNVGKTLPAPVRRWADRAVETRMVSADPNLVTLTDLREPRHNDCPPWPTTLSRNGGATW